MEQEKKINYKNKKTKRIHIKDWKRFSLAILLTASVAFGSYTLVDGIKNGVDAVKDAYHYSVESKPYYEMVSKEFYHVPGTNNKALEVYDVANSFMKLSFEDKDDVYHGLIECARFFRYNLDSNFRQFLNCLDLDEMSKLHPYFPSESELYEFLDSHGFINEDGTIDFDSWRDYDKEVFNMERELNDLKENKR